LVVPAGNKGKNKALPEIKSQAPPSIQGRKTYMCLVLAAFGGKRLGTNLPESTTGQMRAGAEQQQ
jgi:hypothetical protein